MIRFAHASYAAFVLLTGAVFGSAPSASAEETAAAGPLTILVHGGAGAMEKGKYTPEQESQFKADLAAALEAGYAVLEAGGDSLDAVTTAVVMLEDSPHFNAGRGAVFTRDGKNELDASIMDGETLNAGAIAGVTRVKNPVKLARAVMENSEHVMLIGDGAETFAKEQDLDFVSPKYFRTETRWKAYQARLEQEKAAEKAAKEAERQGRLAPRYTPPHAEKYGTVGAVALDSNGNLAAATSTGGMMMKRYGRVGDVPIVGAGVYANDASCAVSSTGWGEYFIRLSVAREICAQVEYQGKSVVAAADDVIHNRLETLGGDGGVIVLGPDGAHAMTFNSKGMFRGVLTAGGAPEVAIYAE
ncbi:MAG: isoaspartyl peptidase/L-asparaginase [Pseudomonadota bacterium]